MTRELNAILQNCYPNDKIRHSGAFIPLTILILILKKTAAYLVCGGFFRWTGIRPAGQLYPGLAWTAAFYDP